MWGQQYKLKLKIKIRNSWFGVSGFGQNVISIQVTESHAVSEPA